MYIGFSAIIALTFNGPHRIDSRAIPDGQLPHFSEQILLLFFSPTVERNIWVKIRHTILRSSLQLIGIILTGDADRMLIIDPICDQRLSLFLLSNAECFSMSFLYVIAHLLSRAIGKITRFRWESQRKQLTRKGERNGEEISRGKTSILPARLKGYRSTPGSKRDLALQLITPDSRKSRRGTSFLSLETEWEIRHENSMKGAR